MEIFRWKRSRGGEVKALGGSWRGWKLVRVGKGAGQRESGEGESVVSGWSDGKEGGFSEKDDGGDDDDESVGGTSAAGEEEAGEEEEEVVAVWAKTGTWTSLHDVGQFAFVGSGVTGELGREFAVMALMTVLCIWQKAMRDQATMGATTTVTSVVVT